MFRSVFAKYITVFMLIIAISFIILAGVMTVIVNNYSESLVKNNIQSVAYSSVRYLEAQLDNKNCNDVAFMMSVPGYNADICLTLEAVVENSGELTIIVTDASGNVILVVDNEQTVYKTDYVIPAALMNEIKSEAKFSQKVDLGDIFDGERSIYAMPIYLSTDSVELVCGTVIICSESFAASDLFSVMAKTVIMASLWIMLAALIAVYFITEKVIGPLKKMNKAAKDFSKGRFDTRVPVKGTDEVSELAIAFNNMAQSLENLENMRNTFMSNVSHDLRTPMTTIAGFIDSIQAGAIPPEKQGYYLDVIATEVRRLSRLVSSLLDISRIQAGDRKFNMKPFDICEMARQILISFEQKIDKKRLDVEFECDDDNMFVNADHDAIYQILYNICDNALKFSYEGGKLRISIVRKKDRKVAVSVYNEGQGIPEADLPCIFDRFYKSDKSRGLDKTGVGLGMYIAKTIIDAHGENIEVKSEYGKYCEFEFTLAQSDAPEGQNSRDMRV